MKKTYEMGVMDLYPVVSNKTLIEDNPFLQARLKEDVQPDRLYEAVRAALKAHPLFGCTIRYKKGFFLEENEKDLELICASEADRPLTFGDATNGFPWQICYHGKDIMFEWCHAVSDGKGGGAFFSTVLCNYFGVDFPVRPALELGLESIYDKSEAGIPQKKQEKGFPGSAIPYLKRGFKTDCHILKAPMSQVLTAAKKNDSSPAAVLPPLFSMALRRHMTEKTKNRNVCCNVVIDCRTATKHETMHNCIVTKNITYVDRFDTMDFPLVSTIYRAILDLALQKENIVHEATKTVDTIKPIVSLKPRFLQKAAAQIIAGVLRHSDSNFTFTYLGKMNLPPQVMEQLEDFNVRSWPDFGECNIAAIDFGGTLIMNICENYSCKEIVPDFIKICDSVGIHFEEVDHLLYEQAKFRSQQI